MRWNISMVYSDVNTNAAFFGGLEVHSMPITWSAGVQRDAEKVLQLEYIKVVQNTFRSVSPLSSSLCHCTHLKRWWSVQKYIEKDLKL